MRVRSRVWRASMAMALALSSAGAQRLATPDRVAAEVCGPDGPTAHDDPNTTGDPAYQTLEDTMLLVAAPGVLANDECAGNVEFVTKQNNDVNGTFLFHAKNGSFTYYPPPNESGDAGVDYSFASEEFGASDNAHVRVTVIPVNDQPEIVAATLNSCDKVTVAEDSGYYNSGLCAWFGRPAAYGVPHESAQVLTGHVSTDHPELFATGPTYTPGQFETGVPYSFTLKANASGTAAIFLWVTDSGGTANGGVNTSLKLRIDLTITPAPDAPVPANDSYSTPFGQALVVSAASGLLKNDKDIDGTGLTASKVSGPAHGALTLQSNGSFTYTPQAGYWGADTFVYKATSGSLSANATAQITVAAPGATPPASVPPPSTAPSSGPSPGSSPGASGSLPSTTPIGSPGASVVPSPQASGPGASGPGASGASGASSSVPGSSQVAASGGPGASQAPVGAGSAADGNAIPLLIVLVVVIAGLGAGFYRFLRSRRGPAASI